MDKKIASIALMALIAMAISGCDFIKSIIGIDTTPPIVASVSPTAEAVDVPLNSQVVVTFSEPMDETAAKDAFSVIPPVAGKFSWSNQSTVLTFTPDTGLVSSTEYTVTIATQAKDFAGNILTGAFSWRFTTIQVPIPPSGLTATTVSSSQIDLAWTDNSTNETGFKIERKTGAGGAYSQIDTVGANVTSYSDKGLSASTPYYYHVCAFNALGDSEYSNQTSATTNASYSLSGTVRDTKTGAAVSGLTVDFATYTAGTGSDGSFTIDLGDGGGIVSGAFCVHGTGYSILYATPLSLDTSKDSQVSLLVSATSAYPTHSVTIKVFDSNLAEIAAGTYVEYNILNRDGGYSGRFGVQYTTGGSTINT